MCYLKADVGGAMCSGAPSGRSRLTDSDKVGSCSCLTARLQDMLGSAIVHQMMFVVRLSKKPCGQWWWAKQQVDNLCPRPKSAP